MTAEVLAQAFALVFDPYVLWVVVASAPFGLFVGAIPGLTATMATALLVPATFFMPPIPAIATHGDGDGDGDLRRRHPELPAAHSRHARLGRLHRRGLCDDAQGPGRAGAGLRPGLLGDRRPVRHGRADPRRADAGRVRAALQLVRVFLADAARPVLRGVHRHRRQAQGHDLAADRPAGRDRRPRQSRRPSRASPSACPS